MLLAETIIRHHVPEARLFQAENGIEAVDFFREEHPDIIFMDVQMPEMNGFDATKAIRNLQGLQHVPIIALTAGTTSEEKEKCFEAGMDDFISKPVRPGILEKALDYWMSEKSGKRPEPEMVGKMHFNLEDLKSTAAGNADVMSKLLSMSKKQLVHFESELMRITNGEPEIQVSDLAHSIKGMALNMGFEKLVDLSDKWQQSQSMEEEGARKLQIELVNEISYLLQNVPFDEPSRINSAPKSSQLL
jgi:CheY-like chemotaxis protein/HPt (histidine-containing phosphotransfer) domain-containing protein